MTGRPALDIDGVRRSHTRLLETVAGVDDGTAQQPSLLPGWNVAMVVTHLARNADGHAFVAEGARHGESRQRYPNAEARDEGIEAGRDRSAAEVVHDLRVAVERLEAAWDELPAEAWDVVARSASGEPEPLVELPLYRWRECEIHHVDLGLGFTIDDWDEAFVVRELDVWVPGLEHRLPAGTSARVVAPDLGRSWTIGASDGGSTIEAPSRVLLAWLAGRKSTGLPVLAPWEW